MKINIYEFFYSADIAKHCQKIKHQFSPLDMAIIIYLSNKPLKKKHEAYRQIIAEYPDMPIHESLNFDARDSLHGYLKELITLEEWAIKNIIEPEDGVIYSAKVQHVCACENMYDYNEIPGCFSTFEKTKEAICAHWDWDEVECVIIKKQYVDKEISDQEITINKNDEIIDVAYYEEGCLDWLDMIYFHLPVPFEKGDLVTFESAEAKNEPYVLAWLPHWLNNDHRKYEDYITGKRGDGSDMCAQGYYLEDGELSTDNGPPYMIWQLSYYKGELKGEDRFLKHLSKYIKEKDEDLDWLISVYMKYHTEAECKKWSKLFERCIINQENQTKKRTNYNWVTRCKMEGYKISDLPTIFENDNSKALK